jgi:hypothetical protein
MVHLSMLLLFLILSGCAPKTCTGIQSKRHAFGESDKSGGGRRD